MKFIQTLVSRFLSKNPVWVTRLQWFLGVLAALVELPVLLDWLTIPIPSWWDFAAAKIVSISAVITAILAQPAFVKKESNDDGGENPRKPPKEELP